MSKLPSWKICAALVAIIVMVSAACESEIEVQLDPSLIGSPPSSVLDPDPKTEVEPVPAAVVEPVPPAVVEPVTPTVMIKDLQDGDIVQSPFVLAFAATDFVVQPAGPVVEGAGHLHLMIDVPCIAAGEKVPPTDTNHMHFGMGQMESGLVLEPGAHKLCLQAGDGDHTALAYTHEVSVVVEAGAPAPSVAFVGLADGAVVDSPFTVAVATENFDTDAPGSVNAGAGIVNLIVDRANDACVPVGEIIPTTDGYVPLLAGAVTHVFDLPAGDHVICAQLSDGTGKALAAMQSVKVTVGAKPAVEITSPKEGEIVPAEPVRIKMIASNFTIEAAGPAVPDRGHFHVWIDSPCAAPGEGLFFGNVIHLANGETTFTTIDALSAGEHTICIQIGDGEHQALEYTSEVTFTVADSMQ